MGRLAPIPVAMLAKRALPILWLFGSAQAALANDLGDAVSWIQENAGSDEVTGYEALVEKAAKDDALAMLNSRDVEVGRPLSSYSCDDAPIDGFATLRTNSYQGWALRACRERIWKNESLPGFVTLGDVRLSENKVAHWVERASRASDVPQKLLDTIVRYVSGYRPGLVSEQGHLGLMQLRPDILRRMGIPHGDLLDPEENLRVGALYFRALVFRYKGVKEALAAFRDGPSVVDHAGGIPSEPRYLWFVREVMRIYNASVRDVPEDLAVESMAFVWTWLD